MFWRRAPVARATNAEPSLPFYLALRRTHKTCAATLPVNLPDTRRTEHAAGARPRPPTLSKHPPLPLPMRLVARRPLAPPATTSTARRPRAPFRVESRRVTVRAAGDPPDPPGTPQPPPPPVDAPPPDETARWLPSFLPFSRLSLDAATWLAASAPSTTLQDGEVVQAIDAPASLIVLRAGALTVDTPPPPILTLAPDASDAATRRSYVAGPGAAFGAADVLARRPAPLALTAGPGLATILTMDATLLDELATRFPGAERELLVGTADAGAVDAAAARAELAAAASRAAALQPYLVTAPKRGIVGQSK